MARLEPVADEFRLDLPAKPDSVAAAASSCAGGWAHHGVEGPTAADIVLATCEAISNAIVHGQRGAEAGSVRTRARFDDAGVVVEVIDSGQSHDRPSNRGRGLSCAPL